MGKVIQTIDCGDFISEFKLIDGLWKSDQGNIFLKGCFILSAGDALKRLLQRDRFVEGRNYKVKIDGTNFLIMDEVEEFKFDEVILVLSYIGRWIPEHFCKYEGGKVWCFPDGKSSLTHDPDCPLMQWSTSIKYDKDLVWREAK